MLVLLPPSEGKAAPRRRGRPTEVGALSFPELASTRDKLIDSLVRLSAEPDAALLLGFGPSLADEVRRNTLLERLPAAPVLEVYTGVLYDALDYATLSSAARRRAGRSLLVQSALWGLVGPRDRIAPYRLAIGSTLPGMGPLAALWRQVLQQPLSRAAGTGVLVDCRSSSYAAAWQPAGELARRTVAVRVFTERDGRRTVVSHQAKHTRGLVARWLLEAPDLARTPAQVAELVGGRLRCELVDQGRRGFALDVLEGT
ncbi:peroxide stress protein YaaA [Microlunatus panaciterrae]|uniref:Cytoplasmic iron level regulating protein YaaA (DUF328/UPF0246 family) n=1 Tax=Microlunatus panaciterrae TaxID=400768 RepID=A0ABS2RIE0_9ACTN|nr:peroxide stress protein YaaA [Microlunatus panaciterrae]MBM7798759.1 cytoplasmic iron level regulating protein YaaA (DUF328/UPF0246 family) [Microlunatus panaciterrae]